MPRANRERTPALVRVLLASNRAALVARLESAIASDCTVAVDARVTKAERLVEIVRARRPDVLLLDLRLLRRLDGESTALFARAPPHTRVLLVCDRPQLSLVETVLQRHFYGYIGSREQVQAYISAIHAVSRGEMWLPRLAYTEAIYGSARVPDRRDGSAGNDPTTNVPTSSSLTEREDEVTRLLRKGYSNKEIATELAVKEDTVKKHLRKVFSKLGVRRRTQLLLLDTAEARR